MVEFIFIQRYIEMSEIECQPKCLCCFNTQEVLDKTYRKIFFSNSGASQKSASSSDVKCLYAVTINVQPSRLMNKKQWRNYTQDQQTSQLTRIEQAIRRDNPSIVLKKICFEICPVLQQVHFHALYEMPPLFRSVLESYYERVLGSTGVQTNPWRHIALEEVYNEQGWIDYITKAQTKR